MKRPLVCLVTFGSAGDVHPMLALGKQLLARGHRVTLLTNPAFAAAAAASRLEFEGIGEAKAYRDTIAHPKLWHPVDGFGVMWRYLLRPALVPTYERLRALATDTHCVVISSPIAMGARVAQEHLGLPLITTYTAATMLRTVSDPMTLAQWRIPAWVPSWLRQVAWTTLDRYKLEPLVIADLERLRAGLGLPRIAEPIFARWMHSPRAGVALFPAWFAPAAPDWPAQVAQAGFPLYEDETPAADAPALQAFLEQGTPPVVFMPGTAQAQGDAFFCAAMRACAVTGRRGILLGHLPVGLRETLPPTIFSAAYAPFAQLLPQSLALVHHGGIGSCAQALRAGIPQLTLPQAYDQFDNAMRVERLGAGISLDGADALARMHVGLQRLLSTASYRESSQRWSGRTTANDSHDVVIRLVEQCA